ncbi:hypothetical protein Tco_0482062 [Tanacetum coccineum]
MDWASVLFPNPRIDTESGHHWEDDVAGCFEYNADLAEALDKKQLLLQLSLETNDGELAENVVVQEHANKQELVKDVLNNVGDIDKELGNCCLCKPVDAQHVDTHPTDEHFLLMCLPTHIMVLLVGTGKVQLNRILSIQSHKGDPVLMALVTEELLILYETTQITDVSIKFSKSKLWEVIIQVDKVASHGEFSSVFSVRNGHGYNKAGKIT